LAQILKSRAEVELMRKAGLVVVAVHEAIREQLRPGVTTADMDRVVADVIEKHSAKANFLNYGGFPASVCISVNDEIVHGIPGDRVIEDNDIVSFDCGAKIWAEGRWWHSDAAITIAMDGSNESDSKLSEVTEGSMWAGIAELTQAKRLVDVGGAIEDYVAEYAGFELIEGYTGHGIGNELHESPTVYNYRTRGRTEKVRPGLVICIEPMVVAGDIATRTLADDWTVVTVDGKRAAHWEHTVAVLDEGISVLTSPDCGKDALAQFGIAPVQL
jgi:methionine aminopeptidase, type I